MDEGFILANKFRRVIFDELISGEVDIVNIAKKNRIIHELLNALSTNLSWAVSSKKKETCMYLQMKGKNLLKRLEIIRIY